MPAETRWFVKAGLCYLAVAFIAGSVMLALEALGRPVPYVFDIEHAHLGSVGWLLNTVIGIALWMLPLNRARFPRTQGRYPKRLIVTCFALLNGGLVLRVAAEPWYVLGGRSPVAEALLLISAVAQPCGVAIFVVVAWCRVRSATALRSGAISARQ